MHSATLLMHVTAVTHTYICIQSRLNVYSCVGSGAEIIVRNTHLYNITVYTCVQLRLIMVVRLTAIRCNMNSKCYDHSSSLDLVQ